MKLCFGKTNLDDSVGDAEAFFYVFPSKHHLQHQR